MNTFELTEELLQRMTRQEREIVLFIEEHGSINPLQAVKELGVMRLAARVFDIASKYAYPFRRETVTEKNRYGEKVTFTKYSRMVEEDE